MRIAACNVVMLCVLCGSVSAQLEEVRPSGEAALSIYVDDDHVTVITPTGRVRAPVGRRVAVDAEVTIDAVTAASIDAVSQASPRAFDERRVEGGVGVLVAFLPTVAATARVVGSTEQDYNSIYLSSGVRLELGQRNTTLEATYFAAIDEVGRVGDPGFSRSKRGHRLVLSLTQVLDPDTYGDLVLDAGWIRGYQASPYRFVPIEDQAGARLYALPERTPRDRLGGALLGRVRRAIAGGRCFLHAEYRFTRDDWGLSSHTVGARVLVPLREERWILTGEARAYFQSGADFYREHYLEGPAGAPAWRSRDRTLGPMRSVSVGAALELGLGGGPPREAPRLVGGFSLIHFDWLAFAPQHARNAVIVTLGATAPF